MYNRPDKKTSFYKLIFICLNKDLIKKKKVLYGFFFHKIFSCISDGINQIMLKVTFRLQEGLLYLLLYALLMKDPSDDKDNDGDIDIKIDILFNIFVCRLLIDIH